MPLLTKIIIVIIAISLISMLVYWWINKDTLAYVSYSSEGVDEKITPLKIVPKWFYKEDYVKNGFNPEDWYELHSATKFIDLPEYDFVKSLEYTGNPEDRAEVRGENISRYEDSVSLKGYRNDEMNYSYEMYTSVERPWIMLHNTEGVGIDYNTTEPEQDYINRREYSRNLVYIYFDKRTLYNPITRETVELDASEMLYLCLYATKDKHENDVFQRELAKKEEIDNKKRHIRNLRQKESLRNLSENYNVNLTDIQLTEEQKDDFVELDTAIKRVEKSFDLGKDIYKIAGIKPKTEEEKRNDKI